MAAKLRIACHRQSHPRAARGAADQAGKVRLALPAEAVLTSSRSFIATLPIFAPSPRWIELKMLTNHLGFVKPYSAPHGSALPAFPDVFECGGGVAGAPCAPGLCPLQRDVHGAAHRAAAFSVHS